MKPDYVLKMKGRHTLTFKVRHDNPDYLKTLAENMLARRKRSYDRFEIYSTNNSVIELTLP